MMSTLETSKGYLIDGYPREVAQGVLFEEVIQPCALVLYFQVSDETMTTRLMGRGLTSGRADDNIETIRKRLDTFHKHSLPVVDHYGCKCKTVRLHYSIAGENSLSYKRKDYFNNVEQAHELLKTLTIQALFFLFWKTADFGNNATI